MEFFQHDPEKKCPKTVGRTVSILIEHGNCHMQHFTWTCNEWQIFPESHATETMFQSKNRQNDIKWKHRRQNPLGNYSNWLKSPRTILFVQNTVCSLSLSSTEENLDLVLFRLNSSSYFVFRVYRSAYFGKRSNPLQISISYFPQRDRIVCIVQLQL